MEYGDSSPFLSLEPRSALTTPGPSDSPPHPVRSSAFRRSFASSSCSALAVLVIEGLQHSRSPTRYRPMEYGDSSPFSSSAPRSALGGPTHRARARVRAQRSGTRNRNRRSCTAETPSRPAPFVVPPSGGLSFPAETGTPTGSSYLEQATVHPRRSTLRVDCRVGVSECLRHLALPTRYRPMEYGDSSPLFVCATLGPEPARPSPIRPHPFVVPPPDALPYPTRTRTRTRRSAAFTFTCALPPYGVR